MEYFEKFKKNKQNETSFQLEFKKKYTNIWIKCSLES